MKKFFNIISHFNFTSLFPSPINFEDFVPPITIEFEREKNGNWYADIKPWIGVHAQLQMVAGVDNFLDAVNAAHDMGGHVSLKVSRNRFDGSDMLVKTFETKSGANYDIPSGAYGVKEFWICNVSKWLFGKHPKTIWFKVITTNDTEENR